MAETTAEYVDSFTPEQREAEMVLDSAVQQALDSGLSAATVAEWVSEYLLANAE